jgi:oxygen-independent coproporphyrinogen-3 oxidase
MTGLRTAKGIDLTYIESRFGIDVKKQFEEELLPYFQNEIAILENDRINLSEVGFFSADRVASDLFLLED